ncbi:MAG TPA: YIP1 family protein [Candidatus Angelobacter sp.]|nr:YIP1 family protein [Candidatus Angelobacter sp.]
MSLQNEPPASKPRLGLMWTRMKTASRLDQQGVLELKTDTTATGQAVAVLVLSALAYGIGFTAQTEFQGHDLSAYGMIVGSLASTVTVCFAAFVWSATTFLVGTKLFQGKTSYWELSRPLFFASSPFLIFLLITVPVPPIVVQGNVPVYWFQGTVAVVAVIWLLLSQVFSIKQVMGLSLRRTGLTVAVGVLILAFIGLQFGTS